MNNRDDVIALRNGRGNKKQGYWTKEEREELIQMHGEGAGITELALHFQRSERAIMNQVEKLGLIPRVRSSSRRKEGCLCEECLLYGSCKERGYQREKSNAH